MACIDLERYNEDYEVFKTTEKLVRRDSGNVGFVLLLKIVLQASKLRNYITW